jgi:hypothetical protein
MLAWRLCYSAVFELAPREEPCELYGVYIFLGIENLVQVFQKVVKRDPHPPSVTLTCRAAPHQKQ